LGLHVAGILPRASGAGPRALDHRHRPGFKKDDARDAWNKRRTTPATASNAKGLGVLKTASRERSTVSHRDASGLARAARGMLTQRDARVIELLPNIKVPALVVSAPIQRRSWRPPTTWRRKYRLRKGGPGRRHAVNIDQPQAFIDAVLPFLAASTQSQDRRPHHEISARQYLVVIVLAGNSPRPARRPLRRCCPVFSTLYVDAVEQCAAGLRMDAEDVSHALGTPLNYVSGRPATKS